MLKERTESVLQFTEGTVYPVLHSLEKDGFVSCEWVTLPSGRRRKVYHLTPAGKQHLAGSVEQWYLVRNAVDRVLGHGRVVGDSV